MGRTVLNGISALIVCIAAICCGEAAAQINTGNNSDAPKTGDAPGSLPAFESRVSSGSGIDRGLLIKYSNDTPSRQRRKFAVYVGVNGPLSLPPITRQDECGPVVGGYWADCFPFDLFPNFESSAQEFWFDF